ncbi:MAG: GxxExxY protein [Candidatus Kapabacteria bacterium]|jgi:GxxExxY protein|nr:GxxExxY protein [Candidatus Kapabacteria bacterium]
MQHSELTEQIIKVFYHVYNTLGHGFLEKVYHKSMLLALQKSGLQCESEYPLNVYYEGTVVGEFFADIIVENKVILELKAVSAIHPVHETQLVNYLRASTIEVGLLLNFGTSADVRRKVLSNDRKKSV